MTQRAARAVFAAAALAASAAVSAQSINPPLTVNPSGVYNLYPTQNPLGPSGGAFQTNYPYPGQCLADWSNNKALFPLLAQCPTSGSFSSTTSQRTGGTWAAAGLVTFKPLQPLLPKSVPPAGTPATPKFLWPVLNPPDYTPDATTPSPFSGADYYEIGLHEAWGFQAIADAGLFPNPRLANPANPVPNGMQWTGLVCTLAAGCACPADASASFRAQVCTYPLPTGGKIAPGAPLFTPVWGVGQINNNGGPVTTLLASGTCSITTTQACSTLGANTCPPTETCVAPFTPPATGSAWSGNNYIATWPSISIRGTKGRPVIVKWTNEFPNNHVFCPHPEAADWPCAIDRTFMGVKATVDPATSPGVAADGVGQFGSPQQPDNSWVTHLHGGEIPPSTDGFAEKWFGNAITAAAYTNTFLSPPFDNPSKLVLKRPAGNSDTYTYPMVNDEATIWFHDHTLGKTHHNVIAGPAGFFPVKDPTKHGGTGTFAGTCPAGVPSCNTNYTWADPLTEPRNAIGQPLYDLFFAIQDRSFNEDGSINFANGLGQVVPSTNPLAPGALSVGFGSLTPSPNPRVHPTWVPEYFADHVLVNGVLWPKFAATPGWYRLRIVDGSDSRCWTIGFQAGALPAPGAKPTPNVPFWVIANDQGYLPIPVAAPASGFTMCPGERYELLINFGAAPVVAGGSVYMTNSAPAPFPVGITPYDNRSPFAEMNVVMRFDVNAANGIPVKSCAVGAINNWNPAWTGANSVPTAGSALASALTAGSACVPANPALMTTDPNFQNIRPATINPFPAGTIVRQVYLNEKIDGTTLASLGLQLNGVPFEYKVTETPRRNTREVWQFINTTGDAHPMHPHLVKHQIVARQNFNVGQYLALLCGSTTCQAGPAPGGEMQVVPDVTPLLTNNPNLVTTASVEGGWKDATQAIPGMVTTIVADWSPRWDASQPPTAPGTAGCPNGKKGCAAPYFFEDVTSGPYVWHCHINSHEDSEMMHTSLVVP